MPMTMGSLEPIRQMGKSWMSVPMPAMIIAVWIKRAVSCGVRPQAPETIRIGAMFATNMARMC